MGEKEGKGTGWAQLLKSEHFNFVTKIPHSAPKTTLNTRVYLSLSALLCGLVKKTTLKNVTGKLKNNIFSFSALLEHQLASPRGPPNVMGAAPAAGTWVTMWDPISLSPSSVQD